MTTRSSRGGANQTGLAGDGAALPADGNTNPPDNNVNPAPGGSGDGQVPAHPDGGAGGHQGGDGGGQQGTGDSAQGQGGKGVSRAELAALRSSFSRQLEEMKATILSSINEVSSARQVQPSTSSGPDIQLVDYEDEDDEDDAGGLDSEEEEALINNILKNQAAAKDPTALVEQPEPTSNVMGMEYLTKSCDVGSIRDGKIQAAQQQMSSPDKKRTCRMVMMLEFLVTDLAHTVAKSVQMFPYEKAMKMTMMKDQELASGLWKEEQFLIKQRIDELWNLIKKEKAHLYLANDKTINKHGYATIDQMEKMEELEKFTTKEQREAFKVASAQMERVQGPSKKRKRPGKGRGGGGGGKPDAKKKPAFAKCAACGRNGHLEGDAKCPKAAEKNKQ